MSNYKSLFKQTLIYGLATVLPRIISFLLNPIYVQFLPDKSAMGEVSIIFSYIIFFNVVLSYGMETAFFRFYNSESDKKTVISTTTISILATSILFLVLAFYSRCTLSLWSSINVNYVVLATFILFFDALCIVPFSKLRAEKKPLKYAIIKVSNVLISIGLTLFFLMLLPKIVNQNPTHFLNQIYIPNFEIGYIFIAGLLASLSSFMLLLPSYFQINWQFDKPLWKKMMRYGLPILVSGIAFAINEHFDKILLDWMNVPKSDIGAYAACYKIGMFMVLFRTAYTLGIEPFFFSHASSANAPQTYAIITKYFVIFGSFICLFVIVFVDLLKVPLVPKPEYWNAIKVVPIIVLANFFLGIYTNLSIWYKLTDKTHVGAYISIFGAVITLLLNYLLIPKYSFYGSALATIAAYGSMMILSYKLGQKQYPIPYDFKTIFGYLLFTILLSSISFYIPILRDNYYFKTLIILIFLAFIYKNEKKLINKLVFKR